MIDIIKDAFEFYEKLPREIMAHRVSAESHRHWHMALGGLSTVLTTLVGTGIFTGLVSQFGLDGMGPVLNPFENQGMRWLYWIVLSLALLAPIVAALHTFMHHAEDASAHRGSVEGYVNVLRRLKIFLAKYDATNRAPEEKKAAREEYDEIMKEYSFVIGRSITLTDKAYKKADMMLKEEATSSY